MRLFADDTIAYLVIVLQKDIKILQDDFNKFSAWEDQWHTKFHAKKCVVLTVSGKKNPIQADYKLHGETLARVKSAKYPGPGVSLTLCCLVVYSTRRFVVCLSVCYFVLVFFSPFSIAITSLGEERANLSAFRAFVRSVLVWICRFPLPLGVWEGLRFVIVTLPGLFSQLFFTITDDLKWDQHIKSICDKANRTIGFLRRNLNIGAPSIKERAYFTLVRPLVEYASTVWDPHTQTNVQKLEMVQRRASRYVKNRHRNTSSVTDKLSTQKWRSLQDRRRDARLCMMYKVDRRLVAIEKDKWLVLNKMKNTSILTPEPTKYQAAEQKEEGCHSSQEQFGTGMRYLQALLKQSHWTPLKLW